MTEVSNSKFLFNASSPWSNFKKESFKEVVGSFETLSNVIYRQGGKKNSDPRPKKRLSEANYLPIRIRGSKIFKKF